MNEIKKLEKKYFDLSEKHAEAMVQAYQLESKRNRAFNRFSGACRRLLKEKLRKGDIVFLGRDAKVKIKSIGRTFFGTTRDHSFNGHYHSITSVYRRGKLVFKNGEWL